MTSELEKLCEKKQKAYLQYQAMQQVNVFGKKPEDRIALDIAAETAKQEWLNATTEYNRAIEQHVKDSKK